MNSGRLVFSQVMDVLDPKQLSRCLDRYPMPRASRSFSGRDQFLTMAFAQITFREGLRDIEACLRGSRHLYAMGIRGTVTRTNLAYANEYRDWRVFAAVAQVLIRKARRLYGPTDRDLKLNEIVYALDSTTIDLCLSLFPWADFRSTKAAVKIHTMIDLCGSIPVFISITEGSVHDVNILDQILPEPGSIYVMDRGYLDFGRLHRLVSSNAYFVVRAKSNLSFYVLESRPVERSSGLRCDQTIRLKGARSKKLYPTRLRRISFRDPQTGKVLVFLTNHFGLPASTIAALYKNRWHIELFFKWIKQNLRIKVFFGTTENAVKTQIWIAICVYLLVACLKKIHQFPESLGRILQILSVNVFQKDPIDQLLAEFDTTNDMVLNCKQLMLNGF
ncbi:MAG: IS4 family transposase [candidate division Zixibacteria bacterium]|nr:IS4 family transposase [candidate division Zixibacteria bacterium]